MSAPQIIATDSAVAPGNLIQLTSLPISGPNQAIVVVGLSSGNSVISTITPTSTSGPVSATFTQAVAISFFGVGASIWYSVDPSGPIEGLDVVMTTISDARACGMIVGDMNLDNPLDDVDSDGLTATTLIDTDPAAASEADELLVAGFACTGTMVPGITGAPAWDDTFPPVFVSGDLAAATDTSIKAAGSYSGQRNTTVNHTGAVGAIATFRSSAVIQTFAGTNISNRDLLAKQAS